MHASNDGPRLIIGTSVPRRWGVANWGDLHFARDLATAMQRQGWSVDIAHQPQIRRTRSSPSTVFLYLRGLAPTPRVPLPTATWLISHPGSYSAEERRLAERFFSASPSLALAFDGTELLQATDPERFRPEPVDDLRTELLFVGNSRRTTRPAVRYAIESGEDLAVFGRRWRKVEPTLTTRGSYVSNEQLNRYYSSARVVLNDHWTDMAEHGIVSNRVFDALACGATVLTDTVAGMSEELLAHVETFVDDDSFAASLKRIKGRSAEERQTRGRAARRWVETNHSFAVRAEVLDRQLRELLMP